MDWLAFAAITAVLYGVFDFFIKQTAGKVDDGLAGLVVNLVAALVLLVYVVYEKFLRGNELAHTREGLGYAVIAGVVIGLATITFIKVFSAGSSISTGVTIVRVGGIVMSVVLGLFILQERLDVRTLLGIVMAVGGVGLVLWR